MRSIVLAYQVDWALHIERIDHAVATILRREGVEFDAEAWARSPEAHIAVARLRAGLNPVRFGNYFRLLQAVRQPTADAF